jgi:hypothetical protein
MYMPTCFSEEKEEHGHEGTIHCMILSEPIISQLLLQTHNRLS